MAPGRRRALAVVSWATRQVQDCVKYVNPLRNYHCTGYYSSSSTVETSSPREGVTTTPHPGPLGTIQAPLGFPAHVVATIGVLGRGRKKNRCPIISRYDITSSQKGEKKRETKNCCLAKDGPVSSNPLFGNINPPGRVCLLYCVSKILRSGLEWGQYQSTRYLCGKRKFDVSFCSICSMC